MNPTVSACPDFSPESATFHASLFIDLYDFWENVEYIQVLDYFIYTFKVIV